MTKLFNVQLINSCGLLSLFLFGLILSAGCGGGATKAAQQREGSSLKPISLMFGQYIGRHRGAAPKTEADFKKFITAQGDAMLKNFEVDNVDQMFISERDGEPFVVHYTGKNGKLPTETTAYIACEKVGMDGKHFAATALGRIEEVPTAELSNLLNAK